MTNQEITDPKVTWDFSRMIQSGFDNTVVG